MFKKSENPRIDELTKSWKKRAYPLGNFNSIKLDGVHRNCIWCLAELLGKKIKWCSEDCVNYALAWARPQCEQGLHVILVRQDFKCNLCGYDYMPYIVKSLESLNEYSPTVDPSTIRTKISFFLMRSFRGALPREYRAEVDHIIAISLGGTSLGLDNHRILCAKCHKAKTKSDIKEKFSKNGNPRKGIKFTEAHVKALSESRKGFDSENRIKSRQENLYPLLRRPIIAIYLETGVETEFESSAEAARVLNLQESNISRVLRGEQNREQHKGWTFKYK